jgi:hypothetical protein
MSKTRRAIGLILASILVPFVSGPLIGPFAATAAEQGFLPPTAAEVFQLRSLCARLGQTILEGNVIGSALAQEQVSHYDPRTNRCYVELTVHTADLRRSDDYVNRVLYDGQTEEMLAFTKIEKGNKKAGMVFDKQHGIGDLKNAGWDDASAYIDKMMADDRK